MKPKIIAIAREVSHHLTKEQKVDLEKMIDILTPWEGSFDGESIAASLYMKWYIQFERSLYVKQFGKEAEKDRMAISNNYHFTDAF